VELVVTKEAESGLEARDETVPKNMFSSVSVTITGVKGDG
jgi:hypothetical protein